MFPACACNCAVARRACWKPCACSHPPPTAGSLAASLKLYVCLLVCQVYPGTSSEHCNEVQCSPCCTAQVHYYYAFACAPGHTATSVHGGIMTRNFLFPDRRSTSLEDILNKTHRSISELDMGKFTLRYDLVICRTVFTVEVSNLTWICAVASIVGVYALNVRHQDHMNNAGRWLCSGIPS